MERELTLKEFKEAKAELKEDIYSAIHVAMWKFYEKTGVNSKGAIYFKWDVGYSEQGEEKYRQPEIDIELEKNIIAMIDIRELTPNCHVMLGDKRVKVVNIDSLNNLIGVEDYYYVAQDGTKYCIGNEPKDLDPIPITEELLKELGFRKTHPLEEYRYVRELDNDFYIVYNCEYKILNIGQNDKKPYLHDWGFMYAPYLHELEAFVYLTTKQELI